MQLDSEERTGKFILDLKSFDEKSKSQSLTVSEDVEMGHCYCQTGAHWCGALGGQEQWVMDYFGCGYSEEFFRLFNYDDGDGESYFKMLIQYPLQTKPLTLKCHEFESWVNAHLLICDSMVLRLGKMIKLSQSPVSRAYNRVLLQVKNRIRMYKKNEMKSRLHHHLHSISPKSEEQLEMLPKMDILIQGW